MCLLRGAGRTSRLVYDKGAFGKFSSVGRNNRVTVAIAYVVHLAYCRVIITTRIILIVIFVPLITRIDEKHISVTLVSLITK